MKRWKDSLPPGKRYLVRACLGLAMGWGGATLLDAQPPAPMPSAPSAATPALLVCAGDQGAMPIDLPTALQMVNASNPTIALARERVREAYWRIREAQFAFLPNVYGGPQYNRHDGLIQNSTGFVFPTNKWNFFIGGGAALEWDTPNLLFGPLIARRLADAQAAAAQAVTDNVQLDAALAYLDLLRVYGQLAINADTLSRAQEMLRYAEAAEKAGLGKPSDTPRARSEVALRRAERIDLQGQAAVASARLAQLLLLDPTVDLQPADHAVLPILLVPLDVPLPELVSAGVANRPEMLESRSLAGAAQTRWNQARFAPLIPRLNVGYSSGDFMGGINERTQQFGGRGDGTAMVVWELHGLGLEDYARTQTRRTQMNEATIHIREVEARVGAEVTAAAKLAIVRKDSLADAQDAVRQAEETWVRLEKSAFEMATRRYNPLEPLLAEQALDAARSRYLAAVIDFNRAQFRLYWAMGQPPLEALPKAESKPVEVPVVPGPRQEPRLAAPRPVEQPKP